MQGRSLPPIAAPAPSFASYSDHQCTPVSLEIVGSIDNSLRRIGRATVAFSRIPTPPSPPAVSPSPLLADSTRSFIITMQTRRKSLNLSDMGVIAPKRSRTASHPSPPETVIEGEEPPIKKSKRSHESPSSPPSSIARSPPAATTITSPARSSKSARSQEDKPIPGISELSPPPSPARERGSRIDTEGINDDVVIGTIRQLEETGNRPHLVRELAAVLSRSLASVEKYVSLPKLTQCDIADHACRSANQTALISSRLTTYLQRPWPAVSPCPLAKEISTVHPRRLYYYLTTCPHQPLPTTAEPFPKPANRIISPSLSSASVSEDGPHPVRERHELSPSPEVDLSSAEFEKENGPALHTPGTSFSGRNSLPRDRPSYTMQRRSSPPLETEERDFKQTATALHEQAQARRASSQDVTMAQDGSQPSDQSHDHDPENVSMSIEPADSDQHATAELFNLRIPGAQQMEFSSPLMKPQPDSASAPSSARKDMSGPARHDGGMQDHAMLDWSAEVGHPAHDASFSVDNLQCPEDIELDELDVMFDAY